MTPKQLKESFERLQKIGKNFPIGSQVFFAKDMMHYASIGSGIVRQDGEWQILAATIVNYAYKDSLCYLIDIPGEETCIARADRLFASLDECVQAMDDKLLAEPDKMELPPVDELLFEGHLYHKGDVVFMKDNSSTSTSTTLYSLMVEDFQMEEGTMVPMYRWHKFGGRESVLTSLSGNIIYHSLEEALGRTPDRYKQYPEVGTCMTPTGTDTEGKIVAYVDYGPSSRDLYVYLEMPDGEIQHCHFEPSCVRK